MEFGVISRFCKVSNWETYPYTTRKKKIGSQREAPTFLKTKGLKGDQEGKLLDCNTTIKVTFADSAFNVP